MNGKEPSLDEILASALVVARADASFAPRHLVTDALADLRGRCGRRALRLRVRRMPDRLFADTLATLELRGELSTRTDGAGRVTVVARTAPQPHASRAC